MGPERLLTPALNILFERLKNGTVIYHISELFQ